MRTLTTVFALAITTAPIFAEGRKVALLVGVGDYKHLAADDQLGKPPVNDVTEMDKVLTAAGYRVVALTDKNATKAAVETAFARILNGQVKATDTANSLGKDDQLLFLFSGHGIEAEAIDNSDPQKQKKHQPFFVVHDSRMSDAGNTMVAVNGLLRQADDHQVRTLFLVDACRNIVDLNRGLKEKSGITHGSVELRKGVSIFYSCSSAQKSLQNEQLQHGLFTYAILRRLRGETGTPGVVTWNKLVDDVQEDFATGEVHKLLGNRPQSPTSSQGEAVRIELLKIAPKVVAKPTPSPAPVKPVDTATSRARDIVEKAIEATGGKERLAKAIVRDYQVEGAEYNPTTDTTVTFQANLLFGLPGKMKMTTVGNLNGFQATMITLINGTHLSQTINGQSNALNEIVSESFRTNITFQRIIGLTDLLNEKEFALAYAKSSKYYTEPATVINAKHLKNNNKEYVLYFHNANQNLVAIQHNVKDTATGQEVMEEHNFFDFKKVQGIVTLHKAEVYRNRTKVTILKFNTVKYSDKIDDRDFGK